MPVNFSSFSVQVGDTTKTYTDVNQVVSRADIISSEVRVKVASFGVDLYGEDASTCAKYILFKNLSNETSVKVTLVDKDGTINEGELKAGGGELVYTTNLENLASLEAQGQVADATVEYTIATGYKLNYEAK